LELTFLFRHGCKIQQQVVRQMITLDKKRTVILMTKILKTVKTSPSLLRIINKPMQLPTVPIIALVVAVFYQLPQSLDLDCF